MQYKDKFFMFQLEILYEYLIWNMGDFFIAYSTTQVILDAILNFSTSSLGSSNDTETKDCYAL
jgi:hypothetical protein